MLAASLAASKWIIDMLVTSSSSHKIYLAVYCNLAEYVMHREMLISIYNYDGIANMYVVYICSNTKLFHRAVGIIEVGAALLPVLIIVTFLINYYINFLCYCTSFGNYFHTVHFNVEIHLIYLCGDAAVCWVRG